MLPLIKAVLFFSCLSLCLYLYSPGIGVSSLCPCGKMGEASGKDRFVLVPCTGCVCLGGTYVAFTPSFRPRSCATVAITIFITVIWYITNC